MLLEKELKILEMLEKQLLAKKSEINSAVGDEPNGVNAAVQRLLSMDCIKMVEPIGEKCFVITKKGTRSLREAKDPEKRAEREFQF